MKKSKIIAVILVLTMLFSGCANNRENDSGEESSMLNFDTEEQSVKY